MTVRACRRISLLVLAAWLLAACGGEPQSAADPDAARALYDRAVIAEMSGDTLTADDLLFELAARHPETTHGRAARARLSASANLPLAAGVAAAVAIPAFMKYVRRSKTTEASMNLRMLSDSALAYHYTEFADRQGNILPPGFPASAPPTPARPHCAEGDEHGFVPQPGDWDHPTWQALNFALDQPHNYQYSVTVEGQGPGATFEARAVGDLNCDGVFSTFTRRGRVDESGEVRFEPMQSFNELE